VTEQSRIALAARFSRLAGAVAASSGVMVLAGWTLNVSVLKAPLPGEASMKANTALAFVFAGLALVLTTIPTASRRLRRVCALLAMIIGAATIVDYVAGWSIGIDQLLFNVGALEPNGRMAPATAICFVALSAALLAEWDTARRGQLGEALAVIVMAIGLITLIGYSYDVRFFSRLAIPTAALFVVLSLGALLAHPHVGWMALLLSDGLGGATSRRLLPLVVFLPAVGGWLVLQGPRAGLYGMAFAWVLIVVMRIGLLSVVVMRTGRMLQRMDTDLQAANQAKFRALLESAPDAMVIADDGGRIVLVNAQTEILFGYSREDLLGQPAEMLVPQRFRRDHVGSAAFFTEPHAPGTDTGRQWFGLRRDGSEFPMDISSSPLQTEDGVLVSSAIRDITERKRLEWQMQAASRMKTEFLANMSHELRTPLNAIIGFTDFMHKGKAGPLSAEQHEFLGDVLTSSGHLLQLVNNVLDVAKVESGTIEIQPVPVDLGALVDEVRDIIRGLAATRNLTLTVSVDPAVAMAVVDPVRVKQILYNYVSNAIKFSVEGGEIQIRAIPDGHDLVRLEVQDTGVGIAEADQEKLFVEFQQLDTGSAKKYQGTGLGLALTKRLTEAHGGRVAVRSSLGSGSTFSAILPRTRAADPAAMARVSA
jgi:PAS domain S-box-containing protein